MQSIIRPRCNRLLNSPSRVVLCSTFTLRSRNELLLGSCPRLKYKPERLDSVLAQSTMTRLLTSSPSPPPSTKSSRSNVVISKPPSISTPTLQSSPLKVGDESSVNKELIFPWVSSAKPLPRLAQRNDLSGISNGFRARLAKRISVALEMQAPLWSILVTRAWEKELAENCSWAFKMAVCGLLSRTFQVPFWDIKNTDEMVHLNTIDHNVKTSIDEEPITEEDEEVLSEYAKSMIEESLLQLYPKQQSFLGKQSSYRVHFQLKPISSRLENAFLVPSLTRDDVKASPDLVGSYSEIEEEWKKSQSMSNLRDMAEELHKKTDHGGAKRSIIVDVSVDCLEMFQVRDGETGEIVQGYGYGKDESEVGTTVKEDAVTHLVRFEVETMKGDKPGERILGSWQIIDIDDMLNGNVWH